MLPAPAAPARTWFKWLAIVIVAVGVVVAGSWSLWHPGPAPAPVIDAAAITSAGPGAAQAPSAESSPLEIGLGALLWALPFLTAWLVRWLQQQREAALLRGLAPRDAARETLQIPLARFELFAGNALRATVADLRRHRLVPAEWIDGRRSVQATVRNGGRVQLVHGRRRAQPEYLLLVDLKRSDDVLGALADLLTELLQQGDVRVERLDFHGDPSHLRRTAAGQTRPTSIDLASLRATCPDHRVLVLSDALSFCDAQGRHMKPWVDELRQWGEVAVLTPTPAAQWGPRERSLFRNGIFVTEANAAGLKQMAQVMRTDRAAGDALVDATQANAAGARAHPLDRRLATDPFQWLGDRPPAPAEISAVLAELRDALGPRAFFYLQALAVFPTIKPRLTLALGRVLADGDDLPLLDDITLARMCRVPWLRQARIPDWLRSALLGELTRDASRAAAARVRAAWATLLKPDAAAGEAGAEPLALDVVRTVDSRLPALVARLMSRQVSLPQRESLLLTFMRGERIPDLAVAWPGAEANRPAAAAARKGRMDRALLLGAGLLAVIGGFLSPWAWSQFSAQPGLAVAWSPGLWTAFGVAGLLSLVSAYRQELAPLTAARWPWLTPPASMAPVWRLLPRVSAVATLTLALAAVQVEGLQSHSLGRIALALWVTVWCFLVPGRTTLLWAPLLVTCQAVVQLPGSTPERHEYLGMTAFVPVLVAWLALRFRTTPWSDWQALLLLVSPLWALEWLIAPGMALGGNTSSLMVAWLLMRAISDTSFRARWLGPQRLDVPAAALLLALSMPDVQWRVGQLGLSASWSADLTTVAALLCGLCVPRSLRLLLMIAPLWWAMLAARVELQLPSAMWAMNAIGDVMAPMIAWSLGMALRKALAAPSERTAHALTLWLMLAVVALTGVAITVSSTSGHFSVTSPAAWMTFYPLLVLVGALALPRGWRMTVAGAALLVALLPWLSLYQTRPEPAPFVEWAEPSYWRLTYVVATLPLMALLRHRVDDLRRALTAAVWAPEPAPLPRLHLLDWPKPLVAAWLVLALVFGAAALQSSGALGRATTDAAPETAPAAAAASEAGAPAGSTAGDGERAASSPARTCPSGSYVAADGSCVTLAPARAASPGTCPDGTYQMSDGTCAKAVDPKQAAPDPARATGSSAPASAPKRTKKSSGRTTQAADAANADVCPPGLVPTSAGRCEKPRDASAAVQQAPVAAPPKR